MHQQQPAEEGELAERVVRRHDRRATLAPADAAPDVRRLDHADVVGAVADGEGHSAHVLLHHVSHQRLLARRHAAAHDAEALRAQLHEQGARLVRLDRRPERSAIDDEAHLQLGALCVHCLRIRFLMLPDGIQLVLQPCTGALCTLPQVCLLDDQQRHAGVKEGARDRDGDGRLQLIAGQHPHSDAGGHERGDGLGDALLKAVLHRRRAQQREARLHLRRSDRNRRLAVVKAGAGVLEAGAPCGVLRLR
mmetsp:Transcript_30475/g.78829  ORF Transcript_30475/g.78829 Transcript_30475/m.78829 type:complete len:249 (-) Transcript_30475:313-1059(-)